MVDQIRDQEENAHAKRGDHHAFVLLDLALPDENISDHEQHTGERIQNGIKGGEIKGLQANMVAGKDYETRLFADQAAWRRWLHQHHADVPGLWMQFAKKASGLMSVNYAEALEVALCYGWIDGQVQKFDESTYLQKFTPRGKRSMWSKVNREKALRLIESGEMQAAGLAAIENAKQNGRWDSAYDSPKNMEVPPDFHAVLAKNLKARRFFDALDRQNRFAILYRLQTAPKPETRAKRLATILEMLKKGEKFHP